MMFCWAHCEMQSMSFCRDDTSPKLETSDIVTSSTCFQWFERRGEWVAKSLIVIRKRIGPNLVPWGTPACSGIHSEMRSKSLTAWRRPLRKLQIQLINQPLTPRWISLVTKMVWSMWSNALLKSRKHTRRNLPGQSRDDSQLCSMSNRQWVVEVPLRMPNCWGSIWCLTSSISHSTKKSLSTLESTGVKVIGRKSPSPVTGLTFGTGVRWESFHRSGNTPDDTERLKITVTGSASSGANFLRRRPGMPSGPEAL